MLSDGPLQRTMKNTACYNVEVLKLLSHTEFGGPESSYHRPTMSAANIGRLHPFPYAYMDNLFFSTEIDFSGLKACTRRVAHVLQSTYDGETL